MMPLATKAPKAAEAEAANIKVKAEEEASAIKSAAEAEAAAVREQADRVLEEAKEQAAALLEGARDAVNDEYAGEVAEYRVVIPGASYKLPGVETSQRFALKGDIVELDAKEAVRLRGLNAIVGKDEDDPVSPGLPDGDNPFGGRALQTPQEHAKKVEADQQ